MSLKNTYLSMGMLAALFLGGCAEQAIYELDRAPKEGSEFSIALAKEYGALAKKESRVYNDMIDARHFALKGMDAASGKEVMPENPSAWDLHPNDLPWVMDVYNRLVFALERGGRLIEPELAAQAQVSFDCMIEELEEGPNLHKDQPREISVCTKLAKDKLAQFETAVYKNGPVRTVMFDYNSANLEHDAMLVIKEVAERVKHFRDRKIMLVGHTDPVGKRGYNTRLSMRRALAVRKALMDMGVARVYIRVTDPRGELKTSRMEVEPKNRHVDIYFL